MVQSHNALDAHSLGLHGLSGVQPSGDPDLPEIQGAFEIEMKVRFIEVFTGFFHPLFEYSDEDSQNDVFFTQYTSCGSELALFRVVVDGAPPYDCSYQPSEPALVVGRVYTYIFGVDQSNVARVYRDGE